MSRIADLQRFYELIGRLVSVGSRPMQLAELARTKHFPHRGVYFFLEPDQVRSDSGTGPRVVRVGTHGLTAGSSSTIWSRLTQHRGNRRVAGGNHRGSIFRLLVGASLSVRDPSWAVPTWGVGSSAESRIRETERELETEVSRRIGAMHVIPMGIEDEPGPQSLRGIIERNAIALLSNWHREPIDPPSPEWLGNFCPREKVRGSGLWNNNHVDEVYDPTFLDTMEALISEGGSTRS